MQNYDTLRAYMRVIDNKSPFMFMGSAALAVRGVRDVNDLDVLIRPKLWGVVDMFARKKYWPTKAIPPIKHVPTIAETLAPGDPEYVGRRLMRTGWMDFADSLPRIAAAVTVDDVFKAAGTFDGYQVISLRHCLAIKALANRPKDGPDMKALAELIMREES